MRRKGAVQEPKTQLLPHTIRIFMKMKREKENERWKIQALFFVHVRYLLHLYHTGEACLILWS